MSDFGDSDDGFENLRLVSPLNPEAVDSSNRPLQDVREFAANFSGSFLEANLFGNEGFGSPSGEGFGQPATPEIEDYAGLDWDASRIFKNISCSEMETDNQVCILRLKDILGKSNLGVLKMMRQMIHCGAILNKYNAETRRNMGFEDEDNVENLFQMITLLRVNVNMMLLELEDLKELIQPEFHDKNFNEKPESKKFLWISAGVVALAAVPAAVYFYRHY
uniref:SAM domain-containing protein n=1 Tax=Caenorhabditis tropicalis TaxID=1561998 RepID=A0A1I7TGH2_9PELO